MKKRIFLFLIACVFALSGIAGCKPISGTTDETAAQPESVNEPETVTVTYNCEGGSVSAAGKSVTVGGKYGVLPLPARNGYAFGGWYILPAGAGEEITSETTVIYNVDHTVFALWLLQVYDVSFNLNGGAGYAPAQKIAVGGKYGALPDGYAVQKSGNFLAGWRTEGGAAVTGGDIVEIAGSHTLYAVWRPLSWTYLNNFNNTTGLTAVTRSGTSSGLSTSSTIRKGSSGNSVRAILYTDADAALPAQQAAGWRPGVKIPVDLTGALLAEIDLYYNYTSVVGATTNRSTFAWRTCIIVLYAGAERIYSSSFGVNNGWHELRLDLTCLPPELVARADAFAVEFNNESNNGSVRYSVFLDDLRAVFGD